MFEKLWEFSVFIREHDCKVLEVVSDEKFRDTNIEKAEPDTDKILLRACSQGRPAYTDKTIDEVNHKVIEVEGKQCIPE